MSTVATTLVMFSFTFMALQDKPVLATEDERRARLLSIVKASPFLAPGNIGLVESQGEMYLVSVGVAEISKPASAPHRLEARKIAHMQALQGMTKFIHGITSNVREETVRKSVVVIAADEHSQNIIGKKVSESYIERISESARGILRHLLTLGAWYSDKHTQYHFAVGARIPALKPD